MAEELHGLFQISPDLFDDNEIDQKQKDTEKSPSKVYTPRISAPKWFLNHQDGNIQTVKHQIDYYYYTKCYEMGCKVAQEYIQSNGQMRRDLIEAVMMCALEAGNVHLSQKMLDLLMQHKTRDTAIELVLQYAISHPLLSKS